MRISHLGILILCIFLTTNLWATHNRSGVMYYKQIDIRTIELTIITCTKTSGQSIQADRPSLDVNWGDGNVENISRVNSGPTNNLVCFDHAYNIYRATHTYAMNNININPPNVSIGPSYYLISMEDPNRNDGIWNINNGNSVNIPFYLQAEVVLIHDPCCYNRSSPIHAAPLGASGYVGQRLEYSAFSTDLDGDSLVYELVAPKEGIGQVVPNYTDVDLVDPGPNNQYTFDSKTGTFVWDAPQRAGEYNIAIRVKSYRNGLFMGAVVNDAQIIINNATETTPKITQLVGNSSYVWNSGYAGGDTVHLEYLVETGFPNPAVRVLPDTPMHVNVVSLVVDSLSPDSSKVTLDLVVDQFQHDRDLYFNLMLMVADSFVFNTSATSAFMPCDKGCGGVMAFAPICMKWASPFATSTIASPSSPDWSVQLFPNPAKEYLRVRMSDWETGMQLQVVDALGRLMLEQELMEPMSELETAGWPAGTYYLQISSKKGQVSRRFVVE